MTTFPVMSLPPELRANIFARAVIFSHPLVRPAADTGELPSLAPELGLLLADRTIHEEAAALFYELNTFRFVLDISRRVRRHPMGITVENSDAPSRRDLAPQASPTSRALTVPTHFINRLRAVIFHKRLAGYWPNGPLTDAALGPEGLGEKQFAALLDTIAAHSGILNTISIELQRMTSVTMIEWDPDPLVLLAELDRDRRFSRIVEGLPQLRRLEIWKARRCETRYMVRNSAFPEGGLETGNVYVAEVEREKLERVRGEHFRGLKSARYERRAWGKYVETQEGNELFMKEGFVLHFT